MSRRLTTILLTMLVLVGAMGVKTLVIACGGGPVLTANGPEPFPTAPSKPRPQQ